MGLVFVFPPLPASNPGRKHRKAKQIQIRCECGEASCPEWAIVVVQGVVQMQRCFSGRIQGFNIRCICFATTSPSSKGGYTFTVGYHELAGTKVTLKKPILVLRKKKKQLEEGNAGEGGQAAEVEMEVIGVIRHKILFKDRPKVLMSKAPTKEKKALPSATSSTVLHSS